MLGSRASRRNEHDATVADAGAVCAGALHGGFYSVNVLVCLRRTPHRRDLDVERPFGTRFVPRLAHTGSPRPPRDREPSRCVLYVLSCGVSRRVSSCRDRVARAVACVGVARGGVLTRSRLSLSVNRRRRNAKSEKSRDTATVGRARGRGAGGGWRRPVRACEPKNKNKKNTAFHILAEKMPAR